MKQERQREFIITENGLEIERTKGFDRLSRRLTFGPIGQATTGILWSISTHSREVLYECLQKLQDCQTLMQIERDFDRGLIKGEIIKEDDPKMRNLTIDDMSSTLANYRLARKQRRHQEKVSA